MKIRLLTCLAILFLSCKNDDNSPSFQFQGLIENVQTFGGTKNETANSVVATNDGGYAVFGFTQSNDGDITDKPLEGYDYLLLKFDSNNQLQWSKTYGGTDDDRGQSIIQTNDGGFVITGFSKSNDQDVTENFGSQDFWVLKLDSFGNIQWNKTFGFSGADQAYSVIQTNDGGYFLSGIIDVTASAGAGNDRTTSRHAGGDFWAIKLDLNGIKEWRNYYGGANTDIAYDAVQTSDNGFVMVGLSDSFDVDISNNKGSYDYWMVKVDSNGTLLWEKNFGGDTIEQGYGVTTTNDGGFVIVGDARSSDQDIDTNFGSADAWAVKVNSEGNIIWKKSYGGVSFDTFKKVIESNDGSLYMCGYTRSSDNNLTENNGSNDAWLVKTDANGNLLNSINIGGSELDLGFDLTELNDNRIVLVGETWSNDIDITENNGFSDALIITLK